MIFPKGIIGPQFIDGDLVVFTFKGAELLMRLPKIPQNKNNKDNVSSIKNFSGINTDDWGEDDQGNRCKQLASQRWSFEEKNTLDNVVLAQLSASLVALDGDRLKNQSLLSFHAFEKTIIDGLHYSFSEEEAPNERISSATTFGRPDLDWLKVFIHHNLEKTPVPTIFIPLTNSLFIMAALELQSLHYAGRTNPYSNEVLKQFEQDLFEDFLSHIKIEYSPETIATINSLKSATPA